MAVKYLPETITKELLFEEAQRRFQSWAKMYGDPNVSAQYMYEDMSCSCYCGNPNDDFPEQLGPKEDNTPVLDKDLGFSYKGYDFELASCNNIKSKEEMLGLTEENFRQRFPNGVFTDRYVCWMSGHKDIEGHTMEESDDPENWCPNTFLVSDAWCWGAGFDLVPGNKVNELILSAIDKFLETFKE